MAEESSTTLNNVIFTSLFNESDGVSQQIPDGECARDSGVTSDLDRAVAALEVSSNNLLEHSATSESVTTCFSSEQKLERRTVNQNVSPSQGWTIPMQVSNASQEDNDETTETHDFSKLRAMFSQTDTTQNITSPRRATKSLAMNYSAKNRTFDSAEIDLEPDKVGSNDMRNETQTDEGDSLITRMKRNFELANNSSDKSVEKSLRVLKKPVSFEVDLDDYVTRDPGTRLSHDPSQPKKETEKMLEKNTISEHVFKNKSSITSSVDSSNVEPLEPNNQRTQVKETTGNPCNSPKSISFDISFEDQPSKRVSPKTMPKPSRNKTKICPSESEDVKLVEEPEQSLEFLEKSNESPTCENILEKKSYSFEVSFEDDSPTRLRSRDRLNKLLVKKPSRTDRPPGEKISASRGGYSHVTADENEHNELRQDKTSENDLQAIILSPKHQAASETNTPTSSNISLGKDTTSAISIEHVLTTENKEKNERDEMKKSTCGISFDICLDEDSVEKPKLNQKPKLMPKHIRLKMTKPKEQQQHHLQQQQQQKQQQKEQQQQQNNKINASTVETTNPTSNLITSKKEVNERDTYTLDEVSNTLQSACERGLTLEDALDDLAKQQETKEPVSSGLKDEVTPTKRGTYSLDEVSTCLVSAADKGLTVAEALDNLANSEEKEISSKNYEDQKAVVKDTSLHRGTYDLNDVSKTIDHERDKGSSLEEALIQLLDEVESVVKETQKATNRGTYDLKDVSEAVQEASDRGVPVEKTLETIATVEDTQFLSNERKNTPKDEDFVDFGKMNSHAEPSAGKRGTYNLDDVEKHLELASNTGNSIVDTLSDISEPKPKETSTFPKINSKESAKVEEPAPTRNTYTLDEVAQSLELAKSKGIPVVEALSNISSEKPAEELAKPGSRGTYTLDEVAQSLETAREKGLPVVMALENLVFNGGGSLKGPAEVAVHRRQGKLTNRKTYALASPLETIGEEKQLRLFDGTSRKLLPPAKDYLVGPQTQLYDDPENLPPSKNVVQTLDLLTSACEALLKTTGKNKESDKTDEDRPSQPQVSSEESRELRQQFKAESRDSGISFPSGTSERGTYSLEDVSDTLEGASKKGIPVIEALGSLTSKEPGKKYRIPRALRKAGSKSESSLNRNTTTKDERQTYSLDDVSNSVEDAKAKGIPVIAALDELTNSLARFSATRSTPGKPLKKPDRPSIIRKKEAARQERANVKSEFCREKPKHSGISFPISYPPAMRNSYSLDDVASAFEKAYQTGIPFQNVLEDMHQEDGDNVQSNEDLAFTRSTGSLRMPGKDDLQSASVCEDYPRKTHSASSLNKTKEFSIPTASDSSLDGKNPSPRKSSTSSEGSLTYSSSYGSDASVNRDSSSTEELQHISKVSSVRKQRRQSNGPFQLKKGNRRNSPANLRKLSNSSSLQGDSVENLARRDSESSDSSQSKRGTYDLKKVGEELDRFKVEGIPVVKGLDKLGTDVEGIGKTTQVTPKRGTYSLEDVSQQLDSEKNKGDSVVQALDILSSNPDLALGISSSSGKEVQRKEKDSQTGDSLSENKTRNTFTLDHVDDSIADAASHGVPVVEALDQLSRDEPPGKIETTRPSREPLSLQKTERQAQQDAFYVEYFATKTEGAPNSRVENGAAVQVDKHQDLDNYPTRDGSTMKNIGNVSSMRDSTQAHLSFAESISKEYESTGKTEPILHETPSQTQMLQDQKQTEIEVPPAGDSEESSRVSRTRPRWQRSGNYVEALESFEEMLASPSSERLDSIPVKESDYLNGKYDAMYPESASGTTETSPSKGRSTWRPSGSVLDEILNLMDEHEERGLSVADALEKAAELSEQQGDDANVEVGHYAYSREQMVLEQEHSDYPVATSLQDKVPLQKDLWNNGPRESTPLRHTKLDDPTVPPSVVDFASSASSDIDQHEQQVDNKISKGPSSVKVFSVFIGDELEQTKQGLTSEQQKKRDRFLRNRQKKMEEERARRESGRQHECREQQMETQKRVRHYNQPEEQPSLHEHTSPPRIIKSSGKSNRKMISNALSHACLSGAVNNENRERCLKAMSESQGSHFIILLKDGLRFRGLFVYSPENEQAYKIYGTGPKMISSNMVDCVYKYSSGSKEFLKISSKTLSISVDGVAINKVYWQYNKPNVSSKTQSNLKRPPRPPQR